MLLALGLLAAVLFGALATDQQARFTLSEDAAGAALAINGTVGAILFGLIAVGGRRGPARRRRRRAGSPLLLGVGIVGFVLSFLCWQVSAAPAGQNFMPLVDMVRGTLHARPAADLRRARRRARASAPAWSTWPSRASC